VFSSNAWELQSKDALLAATAAVDTLCHEIVSTKPLFSRYHRSALCAARVCGVRFCSNIVCFDEWL
jgi:hypothetical protein